MEGNENKIILVFCYGLIGVGKSFVFKLMTNIINGDTKYKNKFETFYISSDEIKAQKISEYRMGHNCSFQEAHDKVNMKSKSAFNNNVLDTIKKFKQDGKIKLFFIDKFFFPDTLSEFYQ